MPKQSQIKVRGVCFEYLLMLNTQVNTSVAAVESVHMLVSHIRFDAFKSLTFSHLVTLQVYPHISLPFFPFLSFAFLSFLSFPFLSTFPFSLNCLTKHKINVCCSNQTFSFTNPVIKFIWYKSFKKGWQCTFLQTSSVET